MFPVENLSSPFSRETPLPRSELKQVAARDCQRGAGDVARLFGEQKQCGAGDLSRGAEAAGGDAAGEGRGAFGQPAGLVPGLREGALPIQRHPCHAWIEQTRHFVPTPSRVAPRQDGFPTFARRLWCRRQCVTADATRPPESSRCLAGRGLSRKRCHRAREKTPVSFVRSESRHRAVVPRKRRERRLFHAEFARALNSLKGPAPVRRRERFSCWIAVLVAPHSTAKSPASHPAFFPFSAPEQRVGKGEECESLEAFDASSRLLERRVKTPGPRKCANAVPRVPSVGADQRSGCAQD